MKHFKMVALIFGLAIHPLLGQKYSLYSNDSLHFFSENLNESIRLNVHLPETFYFSSDQTKYPITIVFDSQHERTYPHIIHSFDLLTSETQIPETIIIGIPFNRNNRLYFTSNQRKENDSLAGIEHMERFIFLELIPKLQQEYKANDFITVIGHSRTAFLVNYLMFKHSKEINTAFAMSGFFQENILPVSDFQTLLMDSANFPEVFRYCFSAGTSLEEASYLEEYRALNSFLVNTNLPGNLIYHFKEQVFANHITNYWISVPNMLIAAFSPYNAILDNWFHKKLPNENPSDPIGEFNSDLAKASKEIGCELNPSLTHIYSLASHYLNEKSDCETAIGFFELGLLYYPDFLDFYVELIECHALIGNVKEAATYKNTLREKVLKSKHLTESEKDAYLDYLMEKG